MIRNSLLTIRDTDFKLKLKKRDIVKEMAPGLTCSGFAAITLTNGDASALLASATSAADGEGDETMSISESGEASSTGGGQV